MREIKFRAWDKKHKEMYYIGQEFDDEYGCSPYVEIFKNGEWYFEWCGTDDKFDLNNKTGILMQYTGLKDKNGKEIYEGDVIKGKFDVDKIEDWLWMTLTEKEKKTGERLFKIEIPDVYQNSLPDDIKIIGNIYDNPELIK